MTSTHAAPDPDALPSRYVDRDWQGWMRTGPTTYRADLPDGETVEHAQLLATRAPLRPVVPISAEDGDEFARVLHAAGRKAAGTMMAAMYRATRAQHPTTGGPLKLRAGRRGSWEAESFATIAWELGSDLDERPKRIDTEGADALAAMIGRWVNDPSRYTEVAATVSGEFSDHADREGGWAKVADQWLQPTARVGPSPAVMEYVVNYLLATAECREETADAFGRRTLAGS